MATDKKNAPVGPSGADRLPQAGLGGVDHRGPEVRVALENPDIGAPDDRHEKVGREGLEQLLPLRTFDEGAQRQALQLLHCAARVVEVTRVVVELEKGKDLRA